MSEKPSDEASEMARPKKKKKKKVKKYKDGVSSSANDSYLDSGMGPTTFEDKKLDDEANLVKDQLAALEPLKEEEDSFPEFTMIGGGMPQEKKPEEKNN